MSLPEDPGDFSRRWKKSNILVYCQNSEKPLHVRMELLAEFSPDFHRTFFPGKKNCYPKSVQIEYDYEAVKALMRVIHDDNNNALIPSEGRSRMQQCEFLFSVKELADRLQFCSVSKLCFQQLRDYLVEMAYAAIIHRNRAELLLFLVKMKTSQIQALLCLSDPTPFFCKNDVVLLFYALTGHGTLDLLSSLESQLLYLKFIFAPVADETSAKEPQMLAISHSVIKNLLKRREDSDLKVKTNYNTLGPYFVNTQVMAEYTGYFKLAAKRNELDFDCKKEELDEITMDIEFSSFGSILAFCEKYRANWHKGHLAAMDPANLYDIYNSCAPDKLHMPLIRHFCVMNLMSQKSADALDVAIKLNLLKVKLKILQNIDSADLTTWISANEKDFSYRKKEEVVVLGPTRDEIILSLDDMRIVMDKLFKGCKEIARQRVEEMAIDLSKTSVRSGGNCS